MDIVERLRKQTATWSIFNDAADEIERLEKENELLQKEVKKHLTYQDHRHGRIGTHDPICYEYGPRHYECALREIERLRQQAHSHYENVLKKDVEIEQLWEVLERIAEEGEGNGQFIAYVALKEKE